MKKVFNVTGGSGPVSTATVHNGVAYISGMVSWDFGTGEVFKDSFKMQVTKSLNNLKYVVEKLGSSMDDVLSCTIYLSSMSHFDEMNEIYKEFFKINGPARVTVAARELWDNLDIEISAIAAVKE